MIVIFAKGLLMTVHQKNAIKGFVFSLFSWKKRRKKEKQAKKIGNLLLISWAINRFFFFFCNKKNALRCKMSLWIKSIHPFSQLRIQISLVGVQEPVPAETVREAGNTLDMFPVYQSELNTWHNF